MRQRIVMALWPVGLVLALALAGLAGLRSVWADKTLTFELANYTIVPNNVVVGPGERITATAKNLMGFHDLVFQLDNGRIVSTTRMAANNQETISFNAPLEPGSYVMYCSVGQHRRQGMEGEFVVAAQKDITFELTNYAIAPKNVVVKPGEHVNATAKNLMGFHDLVFQLDNGRIVSTTRMAAGNQETISFDAPLQPGTYAMYCSVGQHRRQGMEGEFVVSASDNPTPPPGATPTSAPQPTAAPGAWAVVADNLKNPRGLTVQGTFLLISEGGTGPAANGQFQPGNGDGRVTGMLLDFPAQSFTLLDGLTNAVNPGGGVIGANHALVPGQVGPTSVGYGLLSGGPGHPDPKAQLLSTTFGQPPKTAADFWAFEAANNPDGGAIDSNPWRMALAPSGSFFVTDAGANDVLLVNPSTGDIKLYAVMAPVGATSDGNPIQAVPTGLVVDAKADDPTLYVSLLGSFVTGESQIRKLHDNNGDGDAMDENENVLVSDGLTMADDLAMTPAGLFVLEFGGPSGMGRLSRVGADGEVSKRVENLYAASAMAVQADGGMLVAVAGASGTMQTDRVIRIPLTSYAHADEVPASMTPTPVPTVPARTPTPFRPHIFVPIAHKP